MTTESSIIDDILEHIVKSYHRIIVPLDVTFILSNVDYILNMSLKPGPRLDCSHALLESSQSYPRISANQPIRARSADHVT